MTNTPMIQSSPSRSSPEEIKERIIWVLHQPTVDRRTKREIDVNDALSIGGESVRVLLPPTSTVDRYEHYARAVYDALEDDFRDGDVIVSMGGDLHTVTMVDDLLRQLGIRWYCWAKHVGHGKYTTYEKSLDCTNFAGDIASPSDA